MQVIKTVFILFLFGSTSAQQLVLEDISGEPQDLNYILASSDLDDIYQVEEGGNLLSIVVQCDFKTTPEDYSPGSYQCWQNVFFSVVNDGAYSNSKLYVVRGIKNPKVLSVEYLQKELKIAVRLQFEDKGGVRKEVFLLDRIE